MDMDSDDEALEALLSGIPLPEDDEEDEARAAIAGTPHLNLIYRITLLYNQDAQLFPLI